MGPCEKKIYSTGSTGGHLRPVSFLRGLLHGLLIKELDVQSCQVPSGDRSIFPEHYSNQPAWQTSCKTAILHLCSTQWSSAKCLTALLFLPDRLFYRSYYFLITLNESMGRWTEQRIFTLDLWHHYNKIEQTSQKCSIWSDIATCYTVYLQKKIKQFNSYCNADLPLKVKAPKKKIKKPGAEKFSTFQRNKKWRAMEFWHLMPAGDLVLTNQI